MAVAALRHRLARRDRLAGSHRGAGPGAGPAPPGAVIRCTRRSMPVGRLAFQRAGAATAVRDAYAESPLRFLTPRNHGAAAWAYLSMLGGGLVDGDRLQLEIAVGPSARAFVSSQGPTRVFRGQRSSQPAARVAEEGGQGMDPAPAACL